MICVVKPMLLITSTAENVPITTHTGRIRAKPLDYQVNSRYPPRMPFEVRTKETIEEGIRNRETTQGTEVLVYAPGNGSSYVVTFMSLSSFSQAVKDYFGFGLDGKGWLVTRVGYPPMPSMIVIDNPGALLHWTYVQEKLGVGPADAIVLAELIGFVTGRGYLSCEEVLAEERLQMPEGQETV